MLPLIIRGRTLSEAAIQDIQALIKAHWDKSRTRISKILCEKWDWRQPNGRLKDMTCREIFVTLERKGLLSNTICRSPKSISLTSLSIACTRWGASKKTMVRGSEINFLNSLILLPGLFGKNPKKTKPRVGKPDTEIAAITADGRELGLLLSLPLLPD